MAAINPNIAIQCFKMAAEHGITVADIDGSFSIADAKKAGVKLALSRQSGQFYHWTESC